jgi:cytochrome c
MRLRCSVSRIDGPLLLAAMAGLSAPAWGVDAAAADKLLRDNKCFKCHTVDRKKDGPAYRDVAAKFRVEADAQARLIRHLTSGEMAKFPDGHEEHHKKVKFDNQADLDNLAAWILTLEGGKTY